jgi:hypothetical protein
MRSAWSREVAMQNTDFFDIMFTFFFCFCLLGCPNYLSLTEVVWTSSLFRIC